MIGTLLALSTKLLVGGGARWVGCEPTPGPRIYFANHTSHLDTIILWAALPDALRERSHPIAAHDYWDRDPIRRLIAHRGLNALLLDRTGTAHGAKRDPLATAKAMLEIGDSLILFPEGTRGPGPLPAAFRAGLFHLVRACPDAEPIPVFLSNPNRAYPKGAILPAPISCTATFGAPLPRIDGEGRQDFLHRAHTAVCALAPGAAP